MMASSLPSENFYGDGYGTLGAYSGSGYGNDCCPLVVDPLTYIALLTFIAAATYFFQQLIAMSMLARRKRSLQGLFTKGM